MNPDCIKIEGRKIGPGYPVYLIAEMSANHHQNLEEAFHIIRAAKEAGADAIKLQTYTPDTITLNSHKPYFQIKGTLWEGKNLYDLYAEAYTPWEWQPKLKQMANDLGLACFSSPFDASAVDFLESLNMPAYKIASFENVDLPLLKKVTQTGKPLILSTGMANLGEIHEAVKTVQDQGGTQLALLKCTSAYPALPEDMHLKTIPHLAQAFGVPVGLSDHTHGSAVPVAAVALGACIVEKHFTLSRAIPGPDSQFSLEPQEFAEMTRHIRVAEKALGQVSYQITPQEEASRIFRRSLFITHNLKAGERLTPNNLRSIRPSNGLHTRYYEQVLGARVVKDVESGTPLSWDLLGFQGEDV